MSSSTGLQLGDASYLLEDAEVSCLFAPMAERAAILAFERALSKAQHSVGEIDAEALAAIVAACQDPQLDEEALAAGMRRDGVIVPELVRQMRAAIGPLHGARFHLGATSQDAVDTALMIRMKRVIAILQTRLSALLVQLETLIRAQGALPAMARTRYQDALPFTIGDRVRTWVAPLQGLADTAPDHFPLQLGGPIGLREAAYGRNNKAIAEAMAADLQLSFASEAWHTDRRAIGAVASWCLDLATVLGKVGQDVAIMAQTPVGEIRAPGGGSSAMPHKSNPVGAERLVTLARYVAGNAAMLQTAALHENERSGIAWSLEWLALPPVLIGCGSALLTAQELIEGLEPGHRGPG